MVMGAIEVTGVVDAGAEVTPALPVADEADVSGVDEATEAEPLGEPQATVWM